MSNNKSSNAGYSNSVPANPGSFNSGTSKSGSPDDGSDNKERQKNKFHDVFWFLAFAFLVTCVAWVVMSNSNKLLRESHEIILSHHDKSSVLTDSLISFTKLLLKDSTLKPVDRVIICQRLEDAADSFVVQENEQKTTKLLELEFSKIQNEYEVLNLWCALLTVVFLIFSFFSIFKTNEMTSQGEESLRRLRQTAKEAKSKSDDIDFKIKESEEKIKTKEKELVASLKENIRGLNEKVEDSDKTFCHIKDELKNMTKTSTELVKSFESLRKEVGNIIKDAELAIPDKISETIHSDSKLFISKESKRIGELSNELEKVKMDMINIQNQLNVNHSIPTEQDSIDIDDLEVDVESRHDSEDSVHDNVIPQNEDQL